MKRYIITYLLIGICSLVTVFSQQPFDSLLVQELEQMAKADQLAAWNSSPPKGYKHLSIEQWRVKKDSIYRANQKRAEEIFENIGFPGYDVVGPKGSGDFWAIVQHSDFDPEFQKLVLGAMLIEVKKQNASNRQYALLTDRVNINTGEKQIYGSQVEYNLFTGKARSLATIDPENINRRREEVGLEPIEEYLYDMTQLNIKKTATVLGLTIPAFALFMVGLFMAVVVFVKIKKRTNKNYRQQGVY